MTRHARVPRTSTPGLSTRTAKLSSGIRSPLVKMLVLSAHGHACFIDLTGSEKHACTDTQGFCSLAVAGARNNIAALDPAILDGTVEGGALVAEGPALLARTECREVLHCLE
jgi:hypothetical protein